MKNLFNIKILLPLFLVFIVLSNIFAKSPSHEASINFVPDKTYLPELLKDIENAERHIYISMFFFKLDKRKGHPTRLISDALIRSAKKGVQVNLVLEQARKKKDLSTKVNTKSAKYLKKHGIHIRFNSQTTKLHSKAIVIDDIVYIGSHNFTKSAMEYNHEASVRITSPALAKEVMSYIKEIE